MKTIPLFHRIAAAITGLLLTGCVTPIPVNKTKVEEQMVAKTASIVPGRSDRRSVRAQLGEPWISSTYWRFDLFHVTGRSASVPVLWILWWPAPVGVAVDEKTAYLLVTYNSAGRVTAKALEFALDPSMISETAEYPGVASVARVQAGNLAFISTQGERDAILTVDAPRRDEFLRTRPPMNSCRILVGGAGATCDFDVAIDGGPAVAVTHRASSSTIVPLYTKPGAHRLEISSHRTLQDFNANTEFHCQAGETVYAVVDTMFGEQKMFRSHWNATLTITKEMPKPFMGARLAIWSRGNWLVPAEP